MSMLSASEPEQALSSVTRLSRQTYARLLAGEPVPWWTDVLITASSERQAERYRQELDRRRAQRAIPKIPFHVVPDPDGRRVGSGGATLNALRCLPAARRAEWWAERRVLVLHSGGDSRRLPQYSPLGKLFTSLPVTTPWGEVSTVFDEFMALSSTWAAHAGPGLIVASGDVVLTFDGEQLDWTRTGVSGAAMRKPAEIGRGHGVYVVDEDGRVYTFLQKPAPDEVAAAGGLLPGNNVALDIGLLRFDPALSAALASLYTEDPHPELDLYTHFAFALTGMWRPRPSEHPLHRAVAALLRGKPFWCSVVDGEFTHVGTTPAFRKLMTEDGPFLRLYAPDEHVCRRNSLHASEFTVIDSSLGQVDIGKGALVIDCDLNVPVKAGPGAILHGLHDLTAPVEVPSSVVVHQVPVSTSSGTATVIRVYDINDDPKQPLSSGTWLDVPVIEALGQLCLPPDLVWPDIPEGDRTLWNAALFPAGEVDFCWAAVQYFLGQRTVFKVEHWLAAPRFSLASSALWADPQALSDAALRRAERQWTASAIALAESGGDVQALIAQPPAITAVVRAGRVLRSSASAAEETRITDAASHYYQASLLLGRAGLSQEREAARDDAFRCVRLAVEAGTKADASEAYSSDRLNGAHRTTTIAAPPRIDLAGGWSDTPPFCLDWGGTVLNIALELNGDYPIRATVHRTEEPVIRCVAEGEGEAVFTTLEDVLVPSEPGCSWAITKAALAVLGLVTPGFSLADTLRNLGGGLAIRTAVELPLGSGLGTSSILGAAVLRALAVTLGFDFTDQQLSDRVMVLEQHMTTGGGWQDQAGGIFPGAKLISSGPGLRQRIRVQPLTWSPERQADFSSRIVLYYTGIRRIAKGLLNQVVGSYLAREVSTVQVLHSIKTLAMEMAFALQEGEWDYAGQLVDRHWKLNQILDPHTTNGPINALLDLASPYISGAKLAGAGGGGFLILLARDPDAARRLRAALSNLGGPGAIYDYKIANDGLRVVRTD